MSCRHQKITVFRCVFKILTLLWVLSVPFGCKPPADSPQKPAVVRKKIVAKSEPAAKPGPVAATQKTGDVKESGQKPKPAVAEDKDKDSKRVDKAKMDEKLTAAKSESDDQIADEDRFPELYNPQGKRDPFLSPLKSLEAREQEKKKNVKRRIPRTPLEKLDISQMKLTAIVQSPTGNFGLVEESTGKGYVVIIGTFIGINGGKIKQILNDGLIVEEEAEDVFGKITTREIVVKLHKPAGEF